MKNGYDEKINFDELVAEFKIADKDSFTNYVNNIFKVIILLILGLIN